LKRLIATPAWLALCLGVAGCPLPPPSTPVNQSMPPFELAPDNQAVREALMARFSRTHDATGAPCTDDFAVSAIAIREDAYAMYTTVVSYDMGADAAYTATLLKAAPDLKALLAACFGFWAEGPADWLAGEQRPVFLSVDLERAGEGWNLGIGAADYKAPPEILPMADGAPHPFKLGINGWGPR
jgi:hypothetical protein